MDGKIDELLKREAKLTYEEKKRLLDEIRLWILTQTRQDLEEKTTPLKKLIEDSTLNLDSKLKRVLLGLSGIKISGQKLTWGKIEDIPGYLNPVISSITFIIDGGGSAITTGQKGHLEIPFDCEIQRVTLLADQSGSIVIDIWKDTYANFPPTDADSITSAAPPTLSAAQKYQDSTLTGWTKTINAGDILAFNVDSAATVTRITLALKVKKT
jgi:hypothetical protein